MPPANCSKKEIHREAAHLLRLERELLAQGIADAGWGWERAEKFSWIFLLWGTYLLLVTLLHGLSRAWLSKGVSDLVVYSPWEMCSRCLYHIIPWGTAAMSPPCIVLSLGLQGHGHLELVLITSW